jgi:hypothetical protein
MNERRQYEPPSVTELGSVEEVTLMPNKNLGGSDGFTFQGQPIHTVS